MKKKEPETMTAKQFAEAVGVHYRTVLNWLEKGLIPGAEKMESPIGSFYLIPASAKRMERPLKPGPKPAKSKGQEDKNPQSSKRKSIKNAKKKP